jgi:hypothetical protein
MIHLSLTLMPAIATIRDLRNRFSKIRKLVETEGEVLLSENGQTKYRLVLHTPSQRCTSQAKDCLARLKKFQPRPMTAAAAQSLHDENRGDR